MIKNFTIVSMFFSLLVSCKSNPTASTTPDQTDSIVSDPEDKSKNIHWIKGPEPEYNYHYNIAVSTSENLYTTGGNYAGTFEAFNFVTKKWTVLQNLPAPRVFTGGAILENSIYITGGIISNQSSQLVNKYDIIEKKWTSCRNLKVPTSRHAVVACNGKIYVIGGLSDRMMNLNSV